MSTYYSNGKLLISAEYLVLDGAISFALPTKYGQSLDILPNESGKIIWKSFDVEQNNWFEAVYDIDTFSVENYTSKLDNGSKVADTLKAILKTAQDLNPKFLKGNKGVEVKTFLTFPNEWGLGTSSTLINNIASWAKVNPFELLELSFGGSGYDIACAKYNRPITFKRNGITPNISEVKFNPDFKDQIFFVYLNQKQDSKEGIKLYRALKVDKQKSIDKINAITQKLVKVNTLYDFEDLLDEHERILSSLIGVTTVKQKLFNDFFGSVKSLGAWGGDFVMVTGDEIRVKKYFEPKGYHTIIAYPDMIL